MSFTDTVKIGFKNFGHAVAVGAKYLATGIKDVVLVANKAKAVEPEVDALLSLFAAPAAQKAVDAAFHVLGDVATALEQTGADAASIAAGGITLPLAADVINDIKILIPVIKQILASVGATVPAAK